MDFRRALPLLQGLHVYFQRKVRYLHLDAKNTLESMTSVHFDVEEGHAKIAQKNKNKSTGNLGSARRVNFKNILNTNSFAFLNEGIQKEILDAISEGMPNG